jgi:hypothetical protein
METTLFSDDFSSGYDSTEKWQAMADFADGRTTVSPKGLHVIPLGTDPATGKPSFTASTPQVTDGSSPSYMDHIKWAGFPQHLAGSGVPGFDAPADGSLSISWKLSVTTTGTSRHPFGASVTDPQSDLRLASGNAVAFDFATALGFDFWVTNSKIYAGYERVRQPGTSYAAFAYAVPVADHAPGQQNDFSIVLENRERVIWKVDGRTVLTLDRIGTRALDRRHMVLDMGGTEEVVEVMQLNGGITAMTLLDAAGPDGKGLVRLSSVPDHYYAPQKGTPAPAEFFDDKAEESNRLWGQGLELQLATLSVTTTSPTV